MVKLSPSGSSLVYSTLLGTRTIVPSDTWPAGMALDGAGNVYLAGNTTAADFPTTTPGPYRSGPPGAFLAKLSATGTTLLYSIMLGAITAGAAAVDADGSAYVGGTTGVAGDAIVLKVSPAGSSAAYTRIIGGAGREGVAGIAVDGAGNAYAAGSTNSTDFATTSGVFQRSAGGGSCFGTMGRTVPCTDGFALKLDPSGGLVYSTYLGGAGDDQAAGIAVNSRGEAYVAGTTGSRNFPVLLSLMDWRGGPNAFVTRLNPIGSEVLYSTLLGGMFGDEARGIALDNAGDVYVAGLTSSSDLPTTPWALQRVRETATGYVTKIELLPGPRITPAGIVNGATYLTGPMAPGEIVSLFGAGLGPPAGVSLELDSSGLVRSSLAGTRVSLMGWRRRFSTSRPTR